MAAKNKRKNRSARKKFQLQEQLDQRKKQEEEKAYADIKKTTIALSVICVCVVAAVVLLAILAG